MFVFVALQNKLTVDEFPDALDGESHLEDREKGFTSLVQCLLLFTTIFCFTNSL